MCLSACYRWTSRPAVAVVISADVLTTDPARRIAVVISVGVYGAIAVNARRITRSISVLANNTSDGSGGSFGRVLDRPARDRHEGARGWVQCNEIAPLQSVELHPLPQPTPGQHTRIGEDRVRGSLQCGTLLRRLPASGQYET